MPECAGMQGDATGAARSPCQDCVVVQHTSCERSKAGTYGEHDGWPGSWGERLDKDGPSLSAQQPPGSSGYGIRPGNTPQTGASAVTRTEPRRVVPGDQEVLEKSAEPRQA